MIITFLAIVGGLFLLYKLILFLIPMIKSSKKAYEENKMINDVNKFSETYRSQEHYIPEYYPNATIPKQTIKLYIDFLNHVNIEMKKDGLTDKEVNNLLTCNGDAFYETILVGFKRANKKIPDNLILAQVEILNMPQDEANYWFGHVFKVSNVKKFIIEVTQNSFKELPDFQEFVNKSNKSKY